MHSFNVTLKSRIILDQNDVGPLKWVNGPYPIQMHAKLHNVNEPLEISMGPLQDLMGQESLISILEHN